MSRDLPPGISQSMIDGVEDPPCLCSHEYGDHAGDGGACQVCNDIDECESYRENDGESY